MLSEAGFSYVTFARLVRAENQPEYAARMCTPSFYITAMEIIRKEERPPVVHR